MTGAPEYKCSLHFTWYATVIEYACMNYISIPETFNIFPFCSVALYFLLLSHAFLHVILVLSLCTMSWARRILMPSSRRLTRAVVSWSTWSTPPDTLTSPVKWQPLWELLMELLSLLIVYPVSNLYFNFTQILVIIFLIKGWSILHRSTHKPCRSCFHIYVPHLLSRTVLKSVVLMYVWVFLPNAALSPTTLDN